LPLMEPAPINLKTAAALGLKIPPTPSRAC
jgi:hypothetical protein